MFVACRWCSFMLKWCWNSIKCLDSCFHFPIFSMWLAENANEREFSSRLFRFVFSHFPLFVLSCSFSMFVFATFSVYQKCKFQLKESFESRQSMEVFTSQWKTRKFSFATWKAQEKNGNIFQFSLRTNINFLTCRRGP